MTRRVNTDRGPAGGGPHDLLTPMAMAGLIWVCLLVVVVLIVAPLFGTWAALVSALVSLAVIAGVCFAICNVGAIKNK